MTARDDAQAAAADAARERRRIMDEVAARRDRTRQLGTDVAVNLHGITARARLEVEPPGWVVENPNVSGRDADGCTTVVMVDPVRGERVQVRIVAMVEELPGVLEEQRQIADWRDAQLEAARKVREHPVIRYNGADVSARFRRHWVPRGAEWPGNSWSIGPRGGNERWPGGWVCEALERVGIDRVNGRLTYGIPDPWSVGDPDDARPMVITFEPSQEREQARPGGAYWPNRLLIPVPELRPAPWSGYAAPDVDALPDPTDPTD